MRMGIIILAVMLSSLPTFNISAAGKDIKLTPPNPLKAHAGIKEPHTAALNGEAEILCKTGQYLEAIKVLNKALDADPNYAAAYYNRGWAHFQTKQYYESIEDFDRAIGLEPKYLFAYDIPDWAYFKLKQYTRAIEGYDKAIGLNPKNASYYRYRGSYYSRLKQDTKAIPDFDKAIELNPTQGGTYAWRGLAKIRIGRTNQGCADLKKACTLGECGMLEGALEKGFCQDPPVTEQVPLERLIEQQTDRLLLIFEKGYPPTRRHPEKPPHLSFLKQISMQTVRIFTTQLTLESGYIIPGYAWEFCNAEWMQHGISLIHK